MQRDIEKLRAWQRRSKRLRPVSERRRRETPLRQNILDEKVRGKPCAVNWGDGCTYWATDGHEIFPRGRVPGSHLRSEMVLAACRSCHEQIGRFPAEAHERGFLFHAWELGLSKLSDTE